MIAHLRSAKVQITRAATFAAVPFFAKAKKATAPKFPAPALPGPRAPDTQSAQQARSSDFARRQKLFVDHLGSSTNKNRPTTRKALQAYIKNSLGTESTEEHVTATLALLQKRGLLSLDGNNKVIYAEAYSG